MFDISDPKDIRVLDTVVFDAEESEAMYQYKAVLADADKNLIGIPLSTWIDPDDPEDAKRYEDYFDDGYWWHVDSYEVFAWKKDHFVRQTTVTLEPGQSNIRGLYVGNVFYHLTSEESSTVWKLTSYDMTGDYRKISVLSLR